MSTQTQKILQEVYILATGTAVNARGLAILEGMVTQSGGYSAVASLVDSYMGNLASQYGVEAIVQSIAKNGLGMTLNSVQTLQVVTDLMAHGIDSWAKLFELCINLKNTEGTTLDNRAQAASSFLDSLNVVGKADYFTGAGVSNSVKTLLQNIGSSTTSLSNGNSGLNALTANLTAIGIQGSVVDGYVKGATVFADANGDGVLNVGEWSTTTDASGNFVLPNTALAGSVIAFGGIDILTGQVFQGALSAPAGSTVVNPFTTLLQAMMTGGQAGTVAEATAALQRIFSLPQDINLLSYDPLAVLASSSSSPAEKK